MHIEIKGHSFLGDMEWRPHGLCALTGPNGSGKSTLLRIFHVLSMCNGYDDLDEFNSTVKIDGLYIGAWIGGLRSQKKKPSTMVGSAYRPQHELYIPTEYDPIYADKNHIVRDRPDQKWVLDKMKLAFPHMIEPDAQFIHFHLSLPFFRMMYDLRVVAQAHDGAVIPINHPEEGLHPFAIRVLMGAFREMVEQKNLNIILETKHPEILNDFSGHEDQVYLLGHTPGKLVTLASIVHEDELPLTNIGERFLREQFCPQSELARSRLATKDPTILC